MNTDDQKAIIIQTDTPVGAFWMIIYDDVVMQTGFGDAPKDLQYINADNHPYLTAINSYFDGDVDALSIIQYKQRGSAFHEAVWRAMSTIDPGKPVSYKRLAELAGYPTAFRAVGTACGANNLPLIVPCHRVVKADGTIGNYAFGTDTKAWLLAHENRL